LQAQGAGFGDVDDENHENDEQHQDAHTKHPSLRVLNSKVTE
jgi:hypothetical protein